METSTAMLSIGLALMVGFWLGRTVRMPNPVPSVPPDLHALEQIHGLLKSQGKIAAIKAYRELTGVGLRDAKLAVDTLSHSTD